MNIIRSLHRARYLPLHSSHYWSLFLHSLFSLNFCCVLFGRKKEERKKKLFQKCLKIRVYFFSSFIHSFIDVRKRQNTAFQYKQFTFNRSVKQKTTQNQIENAKKMEFSAKMPLANRINRIFSVKRLPLETIFQWLFRIRYIKAEKINE